MLKGGAQQQDTYESMITPRNVREYSLSECRWNGLMKRTRSFMDRRMADRGMTTSMKRGRKRDKFILYYNIS